MPEFKLCYVEGDRAYFTTLPLDKQWGDDWNDAPYEHNAGEPYSWFPARGDRYEITILEFDGEFNQPCHGCQNSPFSVEAINKGASPWLQNSNVVIPAGVSIKQFTTMVEIGGGQVYADVNERQPRTIDKLTYSLDGEPPSQLRAALVDIAERLGYDENGRYKPEESVAASSAADFVEAVKHTFSTHFGLEI